MHSKQNQIICLRHKIKSGELDRVREWAIELTRREEEVLETFANEDMHVQSAFLEEADDGHYLIQYIRADDFDKVLEVAKNSQLPIDDYHKAFKTKALEGCSRLELLIDFENK